DSEETMGKFNVVFGESADTMEKWGDKAADALGVSEDAMAGMLSGMQDLLVPMGVVPGSASEMSKTLSTLAVDLGSFNNESSDKVFEDLQAAMTGSGEVMKKYGVILSESAVKQELLNQGLDPKIATNAQKAQARLNIIMAGTTAAQGDAIRTSGSLANQVKRLGAVASDVSGMLGSGMTDTIKGVVSSLVTGGKVVKTFIGENKELIAIAGKVAIAITGVGVAATGIGASLMFAGGAIAGLQTIATVAAAGITAAMSPVAAPILGVAIVGAGLATVFGVMAYKSGLLTQSLGSAKQLMQSLWVVSKQTFSGISNAIKAGDLGLAAEIGMAGVKVAFWTGLEQIHRAFIKSLPLLSNTIKGFLTWWVKSTADAAITVAKSIANPLGAAKVALDYVRGDGGGGFSMPNVSKYLLEQRIASQKNLDTLTNEASVKAEATRVSPVGQQVARAPSPDAKLAQTNRNVAENTKQTVSLLDALRKTMEEMQRHNERQPGMRVEVVN
ncbi:hypothetical protein, partial [Rhodopirellula bahusiensis]